jgi:hypothetical protein
MGLWSDWYSKNAGKENRAVNAEFVLKKIDEALASHNHDTVYAKLSGATFTGAITATSFTATSSKTDKKNIKPFKKSALDIIDNVDIVSFKYKKSEDPMLQIGFIAENTDPLLSGEDQKGMRINTTIGLLLKAVQELNEKIEILENELHNRNIKHLIPKEKKK